LKLSQEVMPMEVNGVVAEGKSKWRSFNR
jgi:hypothetical protein